MLNMVNLLEIGFIAKWQTNSLLARCNFACPRKRIILQSSLAKDTVFTLQHGRDAVLVYLNFAEQDYEHVEWRLAKLVDSLSDFKDLLHHESTEVRHGLSIVVTKKGKVVLEIHSKVKGLIWASISWFQLNNIAHTQSLNIGVQVPEELKPIKVTRIVNHLTTFVLLLLQVNLGQVFHLENVQLHFLNPHPVFVVIINSLDFLIIYLELYFWPF